ncbi:hypothetical protein PG994_010574 [Apiospora phragmitis]|uniref:Uncharacterized protein n=1 Tax=Apiospora phragmitis TaxID=2905665 RepID=A0ABR1TSY0_9PEZI
MPLPPMDGNSKSILRAILLCPQEVGSDATRQRIERLYHLDGGQHVAIVFFMKQSRSGGAAASLMRLQLEYVGTLHMVYSLVGECMRANKRISLMNGLEMPIIPVSSIGTVPATLLTFNRQLATAGGGKKTLPASRSLLPYCSGAESLSEHAANVLSDVTTGMKDLSEKAMSAQGKQELIGHIGEAEAERAINFWNDEFPMD